MTNREYFIKKAQRKNGIKKDKNKFQPNNKKPIPASFENARYTGACSKGIGGCKLCNGSKLTLGELSLV